MNDRKDTSKKEPKILDPIEVRERLRILGFNKVRYFGSEDSNLVYEARKRNSRAKIFIDMETGVLSL